VGTQQADQAVTTEEYCRAIEAYLCRKNDGHLIRIVGPSFERVCGWAEQGIPYKVTCEGIDRYFVRYYAKKPRRRPVRIDFCEEDVLDAFDAWRRAVGVRLSGGDLPSDEATPRRRPQSLPEHLDRGCEKITNRRAGVNPLPADYDRVLEGVTRELSAFKDLPSPIRGDARERVIARLSELDRLMMDAVRAQLDDETLRAMHQEAAEELRPFRDRMPDAAYQRAVNAAVDSLLRDREKLPLLSFS
jgi:hypothetical protein